LGDDKLVTVACDAESTDLLATAHDGIEAGKYIDYAWSGIFDKVVDAYADLSPLSVWRRMRDLHRAYRLCRRTLRCRSSLRRPGIEAGKYIDYAWSGIFDKVVDAYADGAKLKPIAGLEQSKYGCSPRRRPR